MPQIYDMGPTALLPLRRKKCLGFFRPKNQTASVGFEPANLGTKSQHATPRPPKPLLCPIHNKIKYDSCRIISTLLVSPIASKSYPAKFSSLSFRFARFNGVDRKFHISTIVSHFLRQSLVLAYWKCCTIQFLHHTEYTMWTTIPLNMPTTLPGNSNATIFCGNKQLNMCWLLLRYLGNDAVRHSNGSNPASRSLSYLSIFVAEMCVGDNNEVQVAR